MALESAGPVLLEGGEELVQPSVHPKLNELYVHGWSTPDAKEAWEGLIGRIRDGREGLPMQGADIEPPSNLSNDHDPAAAGSCETAPPQRVKSDSTPMEMGRPARSRAARTGATPGGAKRRSAPRADGSGACFAQ